MISAIISVMTRELLDDLGINDVPGALRWSASTAAAVCAEPTRRGSPTAHRNSPASPIRGRFRSPPRSSSSSSQHVHHSHQYASQFHRSGIAAALAAPWLGTRAAEKSVGPDRVSEPAREVPLNDDADVIV